MTLLRQLMLVILLIYIVLFSANFVLTILDSRQYVEAQLTSHAQDTATSLAVSMTNALADNDQANLDLLANAVFDRGYYQRMTLLDLDHKILLQRENPVLIDDVPAWFIELIDLPYPSGSAEIIQGWNQLGVLTVVSNPGHAYRDLWRISVDYFYLFCFILVLSYGLIGMALKYLMAPLREVERQANEICERRFPVVDKIPKTRELRHVVEAMNRMSVKVREMFQRQVQLTEDLRKEARTDLVTGLINRNEFTAQTNSLLNAETGSGSMALMLLQVRNFNTFNSNEGRSGGDLLLSQIAERLSHAFQSHQGVLVARYSGADFAVLVPDTTLEHARVMLETGYRSVASLALFTDEMYLDALHAGMVFHPSPADLSTLLTEADTALRSAQAGGKNATHFLVHGDSSNPLTEVIRQGNEWKRTLDDVITNRSFLFHYQPVLQLPDRRLIAQEIFVRIRLDGEIVNAGLFMPMAERFDLLVPLDRLIIESALQQIDEGSPAYVLNLSTRSLQDPDFCAWLISQFPTYQSVAHKVIFELQEHAVHLAYDAVRNLVENANVFGFRISIDHFGSGATAFSYLQSLDVHYIKIDRSFVSGISDNHDNQFFVQSVAQIAHTRDMQLLAEGVEEQAELDTLIRLGVDGAMGYLLGRPGPDV
ncbi:MAG: EAL domain-containing protein [Pseudomonadales bacterium]|nr:EAL domain-containing protein [Pseudomonadales bacterium]